MCVCVCVCVCLGQSGLGKSTLMNTLFKSKVSRKSVMGTGEERIPKTIEIKSISHGALLYENQSIQSNGKNNVRLTVLSTNTFCYGDF